MKKLFKCFLATALIAIVSNAFSGLAYSASFDVMGNDETGFQDEENQYDRKYLKEAAQAMRRAGVIQLDFKNIDLAEFIYLMTELLQENILVPFDHSYRISIISPNPLSTSETLPLLRAVLRIYGFSLYDMGSYRKIVQEGGQLLRGFKDRETLSYITRLDYRLIDRAAAELQSAFGEDVFLYPFTGEKPIVYSILFGRPPDVSKALKVIEELNTNVISD